MIRHLLTLLAILGVVLDLALRHTARSWSLRLARYTRRSSACGTLLAAGVAGLKTWAAGGPAASWFGVRPLAVGLLVNLGLAGLILGLGTWQLGTPEPFLHGVRYFVAPAVAVAAVSVLTSNAMMKLLAVTRVLWIRLVLVLLLPVVGALLWLALMHAATWLEWQTKQTPVAWGSEWFYAEAYLFYAREPGGRVVAAAAAAAASGVALWYGCALIGRLTGIATASLLRIALDVMLRMPRGIIAGSAVALMWVMWRQTA